MKALSIRQPHAEAIMRGVKPIEFRSRRTDMRGRITGSGGNYEWHVRNPERATELLKPTKRPQPIWFSPF